jgi:hypothetical protein
MAAYILHVGMGIGGAQNDSQRAASVFIASGMGILTLFYLARVTCRSASEYT